MYATYSYIKYFLWKFFVISVIFFGIFFFCFLFFKNYVKLILISFMFHKERTDYHQHAKRKPACFSGYAENLFLFSDGSPVFRSSAGLSGNSVLLLPADLQKERKRHLPEGGFLEPSLRYQIRLYHGIRILRNQRGHYRQNPF